MSCMSLNKRKSATILIAIAVLFFVLKAFLGFALFSRLNPPAQDNIFVKVFSKRKLEDSENSETNVKTLQKNLADPVLAFTLLFSFLLGIIYPAVLMPGANIDNRVLRLRKFRLFTGDRACLLNGKLTI